MSFIQRELERLGVALRDPRSSDRYDALYTAQQALSWALDPEGFKSPYVQAMGIQEGSVGCSDPHHLAQS